MPGHPVFTGKGRTADGGAVYARVNWVYNGLLHFGETSKKAGVGERQQFIQEI